MLSFFKYNSIIFIHLCHTSILPFVQVLGYTRVMSKKVYLVRHGESEDGASAVYQSDPSPLSPAGIKQAEILARRFESIHIDVVYASPFPRAHQTAEIILPSQVEDLDLLRELKRPSEIIGKPLHDPSALEIKAKIKEHIADESWHHSDEENFYEIRDRVCKLLDFLERDTHETILIVSHAIVLRVLSMLMIFGRDADHKIHDTLYNHFRMTQTGITLLEHSEKGWLLMTWNDYAHLGEDTTENFYRNRQDI